MTQPASARRYARQESVIGAAGQAALGRAHVLVVGAGGLGATLLPLLAGAGVGQLTVLDHDRIEESNLHRQTLYRMADLGQPKAEVAARALRALNPAVQVRPLVARFGPQWGQRLVPQADVVVDAADAFVVSYALSDACLALGKPLVSASVLGRRGYAGAFCGGAPSYRALFPAPPAQAQTCASAGVMGPAVALLAALQAQMVLALLLGHSPSPLGQMLTVDLATWRMGGFEFAAAEEVAGPPILSAQALTHRDRVIELRDLAEAPEPAHPRAQRCPPEALASLPPCSGRTVFACATGLRAWRAAVAYAGESAILAPE